DRSAQGRGADHAAAAYGRGQGPRSGPDPRLRALGVSQAVVEDREPGAVARTAAVAGGPREARRAVRVHPVLLLHPQLPELLVEFGSLPPPCPPAPGPSLAARQA